MTPASLQVGLKHFSRQLFQLHALLHVNTNFIRSLDLCSDRVHLETLAGRNLFSDRNVSAADILTDAVCIASAHIRPEYVSKGQQEQHFWSVSEKNPLMHQRRL